VTDQEAMKNYLKAFGNNMPGFDTDYWEKIHRGTQWMLKTYPESDYTELCERYLRACLEIVSIEEMIKKGVAP